jgi:hypothetical protein
MGGLRILLATWCGRRGASKIGSKAEGPMGYREWARRSGRLEYIHSIDDRYDHNVD